MINVIVCDDYNQLSNVAFEIMLSVNLIEAVIFDGLNL